MDINLDLLPSIEEKVDISDLLSDPEDKILILRLLWGSPVEMKSLQLATDLPRYVVAQKINVLIEKGLVERMLDRSVDYRKYKFTICLSQENKSEIRTKLYLYDPPLMGLDLRGKKYMTVYRECQETLSKVFEWEHEIRGVFSWNSLIRTADFVGLPIKTCCQFLEYMGKIQDCTWDRMEMKNGLTSKQLREKMEEEALSFIANTEKE
jgi:hypothetical protein